MHRFTKDCYKLRWVLLLLLGSLAAGLHAMPLDTAQPSRELIDIYTLEDRASGEVQFFARNDGFCPYQIRVSFSELKNYRADGSLPRQVVVPPDHQAHQLLTIKPRVYGEASYEALYEIELGDPTLRPNPDQLYLLPFRHGERYRLSQGYNGDYSHQGRYALDFETPEGTPITAVRSGVVVDIKEDSDRGGGDASFEREGNFVLIYHSDGTLANYSHLRKDGVVPRLGDRVEAGELIGYSGHTGWAVGPHLHLEILHPGPMQLVSIPTRFLGPDEPGHAQTITEFKTGRFYYGVHPGQPPFRLDDEVPMPEEGLSNYKATASATGKVEIVRRVDGTGTHIYLKNGFREPKEVELKFELRNLKPSSEVPNVVKIEALTEIYLFSATVVDATRAAGCQVQYAIK